MEIYAEVADRALLPHAPLALLIRTLEKLGTVNESSLNIQSQESYPVRGENLIIDGGIRTGGIAISLITAEGIRFRGIVRSEKQNSGAIFYQRFYRALQDLAEEDAAAQTAPTSAKVPDLVETWEPRIKPAEITPEEQKKRRLFLDPERAYREGEKRRQKKEERQTRKVLDRLKRRETDKLIRELRACLASLENKRERIRTLYAIAQENGLPLPPDLIEGIRKETESAA